MITLTDDPDPHLEAVLDEGLAEHNAEMSQASRLARAGRGGARPGYRRTGRRGAWPDVDGAVLPRPVLPAEEAARRRHRQPALHMAEEEAIRRGCRAATLVTVNFQAPEFYARHGWEEFGRIASAPGVERIFMRKTFAV